MKNKRQPVVTKMREAVKRVNALDVDQIIPDLFEVYHDIFASTHHSIGYISDKP